MVHRHRSLTGCGACRTRHLKCDESRPGCQMCQTTGIACPGYNAQIRWPTAATQTRGSDNEKSEDRVFRRPLYQGQQSPFSCLRAALTDANIAVEQEVMTKATVNSLGQTTANVALDHIERWEETGSGPCLFQGPFGVLDFLQPHTPHNHNHRDDILDSETTGENDCGDPVNADESFTADMNSIADESALPQPSAHHHLLESTPLPTGDFTSEHTFQDALSLYQPTSLSSVPSPTQGSELSSTKFPPLDLLRHFKDNVLSFSFPLRGNPECPWQTIHLATAMSAYAELLVSQSTSHPRLSLLHSLVSASCLHRANHSRETTDYGPLRVSSHRLAKEHLQLALEEEITGIKPVKYKEILMAILSMVYLEVCQILLLPYTTVMLIPFADFIPRLQRCPNAPSRSRVFDTTTGIIKNSKLLQDSNFAPCLYLATHPSRKHMRLRPCQSLPGPPKF